jgi:competence protein ComEC
MSPHPTHDPPAPGRPRHDRTPIGPETDSPRGEPSAPSMHSGERPPRRRRQRAQEEVIEPLPVDLRLVAPALAAWLAAVVGLAAAPPAVVAAATAAALPALLLWGAGSHAHRKPAAGQPTMRRAAAATLLCAAASALVATSHATDLHRGPLPTLAQQRAHATVEFTVTGDPRAGSRRVRSAGNPPPLSIVEGTATRVTAASGATAVRTPVLVLARGAGAAQWLRLLPSTRVAVDAAVVPPAAPGDRVAAVLRVHGPPRVTHPPTAVQRLAGRLRDGLREATDGLAPDARALLPGLVIGDVSRIPPDLAEDFRATDLTHLTAVSGSNLTLLLALLIGPAGRAIAAERGGLAPRIGLPLRATAVVGGALTTGFVVLCRPEPSVLRAAACGLVTLLAIGTGRRRETVPALAGAVLLLVLADPWLARSYGFLLSVAATTALLTVAPRWSEAMRRRGVPGRLAEALGATAAAQAACTPVLVAMAGRVSLVAVPCNLLAELAVAPATVLGFAALAVAPVAMPAARALAWLAGRPAGWIAAVARHAAALPGAQVGWPGGWAGALLLAAAALTVPLAWTLLRGPVAWGLVAVLLLVVVVSPAPLTRVVTGWPPPRWRLAVCDVGQGDAMALAAGPGSAVVVDAGPDPRPVDDCLRRLGVTRIPLLVLTHFHADHVTGLPGVLHGRSVGAIETTRLPEPAEESAMVLRVAAAAHIPVLRAAAGERRGIGPLTWRVLWPPASGPGDPGPNNASVVLLVRVAGLSVLLAGDVEPPAQQRILAAFPGLPRIDVLKVAHHGSRFQDPALLRRLHPRLAIVSCGRDNPYGHPSPHTLATLRSLGAAVLRTDEDGSIAVAGGPGSLRVAERSSSRHLPGAPPATPRRPPPGVRGVRVAWDAVRDGQEDDERRPARPPDAGNRPGGAAA